MKRYLVKDIFPGLTDGCELIGLREGLRISNVKPIFEADEETLTWVNPSRSDKQALVENTAAKVIICNSSIKLTEELKRAKCFIVTDNPKLEFLRIVEKLFLDKPERSIHPTATIHPEAIMGENVGIGANSVIGKGIIGSGTVVYSNVHIYDNFDIGSDVVIHSGVVIGADGFGYARNANHEFEHFPHVGSVLIEDNVHIGANTCIDRGSLGNTHLKNGVKIDNLVHIAHNVVVGEHTAIAANAMIAGSTVIGCCCWIAPSVAVMDAISIGDRVTIGLGAVVLKSVPDGETWIGNPALNIRDYAKTQKKLKGA